MIWHSTSIDEIVQYFESDTQNGLSEKAVSAAYKEYGKNTLYSTENKSFLKNLGRQLKSYTFIIGLISALFYLGFDFAFMDRAFRVPAVIIFVLMCYVFIVAFVETITNKRIISRSQSLDSMVTVLRNGREKRVSSVNIVPGDIIILREGDYIPADARLIDSNNLRCEESIITGNVSTVEKNHTAICEDIAEIGSRVNMIYAGCCVAFGDCKAIVTETGAYTERGKKITALLREENVIVPVQAKIRKTMAIITSAFLFLSVVFFALGMFIGRTEYDWREFVLIASLLFSVTVPCAYSLLVTFNLVMGMRRAKRKNCIIKKISSLETLCAANVFICDKTGTLTQNRMKAAKVFLNNNLYDIDNFAPDEVASMLKLAALTCDGDVIIDDFGREKHYGDTVETAILSAAFKVLKTDKTTIDSEYPRMGEIPLDSVRKVKTVICIIDGKPYAIVKGIAENIIDKCPNADKEVLNKTIKELSTQAYRVIGIAYKQLDELPSMPSAELIENGLTFSGLIAVANLPRFDAKIELEECNDAGIRTIMVTGDNLENATASAKKIDLLDENSICVSGEMLENMSDEEFNEKFENIAVYANISAEQRLMIVKKWQSLGKTVAITGDSVSDAIALKEADVGCAMGIAGTEIAKSASELIITDDSYTSIIQGIKEIKGTYLNIRKSLKQFISSNLALIISMILGIVFFRTSILTPMLVLFAGLFFNTVSTFTIAFEPAHKKVLKRQIFKNDNIVGNEFSIDIAVGVLAMVIVSLFAYFYGNKHNFGEEYYFTVFVLSSIFLGYSNRTDKPIFTLELFRNPFLSFAVVICVLILAVMVMFTPAATFLKIRSLKIDQVIKCLLLSLLVPAVNELYKLAKQKFFN
ncbi:MAG: cation-translocating P-type ATPase [Acutalibacteraceae bacterium]